MKHIIKIGKWFYFKRRIPNIFLHLYKGKAFIKVTLKTDSEIIAQKRVQMLNSELENLWHNSALNETNNLEGKFALTVNKARLNGFTYLSTEDVATQDIDALLKRIMILKESKDQSTENISALLGRKKETGYTIQNAFYDFVEFEKPNLLNKSEDQIRKWNNPRIKAINNFINVCGDMEVQRITRQDILKFRDWWHQRIVQDELTPNSANKDFGYIAQVIFHAKDNKNFDLDVRALMIKIRFAEIRQKRPPFETDYIQKTLLDLSNFKSLNEECSMLLFAIADTGARISELVGLNSERGDICLEADIPYIYIRPDKKRALKTKVSERKIPLVGASLYAFKKLPKGFQHYYQKADLISATLNKHLKEHDLLPTEKHTVYSLRHSMDDRLINQDTPDKVVASIMGHTYGREDYGKGPTLEQKKRWLDKIRFEIN